MLGRAEEDYPESEMDDWEWDDLEHETHIIEGNHHRTQTASKTASTN